MSKLFKSAIVIGLLFFASCAKRQAQAPLPPPPPTPPFSAPNITGGARATCATCPVSLDPSGSTAFAQVQANGTPSCLVQTGGSFPMPDPNCTPGAFNPSITLDVLTNPDFRTGCIRDCVTQEGVKATTYDWYGIPHPAENHGATQVCELDHLVPLELGGADTLDNIWPQCGPDGVSLNERYFKIKDNVENYLTAQVKSGTMDLDTARAGIARDWTQYVQAAGDWRQSNGSR